MSKIKYTEREKLIISIYDSVLKDLRDKLEEKELLLDLNSKYLKYTFVKKRK